MNSAADTLKRHLGSRLEALDASFPVESEIGLAMGCIRSADSRLTLGTLGVHMSTATESRVVQYPNLEVDWFDLRALAALQSSLRGTLLFGERGRRMFRFDLDAAALTGLLSAFRELAPSNPENGLSNETLNAELAAIGITVEPSPESPFLLAAFEAVGKSGAIALLKIDGERTMEQVYTVMLSGGRLADDFFRKDGPKLHPMMREALTFYVRANA